MSRAESSTTLEKTLELRRFENVGDSFDSAEPDISSNSVERIKLFGADSFMRKLVWSPNPCAVVWRGDPMERKGFI